MARKERNIYKRKDGRYEARYIKSRDAIGKARYGAVYARTYAEVKEKLRAVMNNASPQKSQNGLRQSVVNVMENYLEVSKHHIKESTYWVYHGYIENHIKPYFDNMHCNQLNQEVVRSFVNGKLENGMSAITVQSIFSLLRNGTAEAHTSNAFQIKLPRCASIEAEVLSIDEQKRLEIVARLSDDINRVGVILCLYTGIRVGELCGLMWGDIDFDRELLHVRRTMQRIKDSSGNAKTKLAFLSPKSQSSRRSIPLPEFLLCMLREHQSKTIGDYVISRGKQPVEPRNMQLRFKRLLLEANIKPLCFHTTRHCFATRALESGFDIKTLSELLGHSSPVVTLKKYAHVLDEHKRKSMASLASIYQ